MQGSGKGTQARLLIKEHKYQYFSVGDILRDIVKSEKSKRAKEIKNYINNGTLVPDEIIFSVLFDFLKTAFKKKQPVIFDGLPRNLVQYRMLRKILKANKREYVTIFFDLPLAETLARIEARKKRANLTEELREDDKSADKILTRLEAFFVHSFPAIKEAILEGKLKIVNALPGPEDVYHQLKEAIGLK